MPPVEEPARPAARRSRTIADRSDRKERTMQTRRPTLPILALVLFTAACGRLNGGTSGDGSGAIHHPTGATDLILRWETTGGFVAPESILGRIPAFSLYGDGTLITEGVQTDIYPGPALPPLLEQRVSEAGIQAILAAAEAAGLMHGDVTFPPCAADVPSTVVTLNAGGRSSVVTLGGLTTCAGSDNRAEEKVTSFLGTLATLPSWLPAGSIGRDEPYGPTALRVFVRRYQPDPPLTEPPVRWPAAPLSSFDQPAGVLEGVTCGVVGGADAAGVLAAARNANQLTPWVSRGERFSLVLRPLLPDESGC
jgi:hypothetical protein